MPKGTNALTKEQQAELRGQLSWTNEEFDVEALDGAHSANADGRWRIRVVLGKRSVVLYEPSKGHIKTRRSLGAHEWRAAVNQDEQHQQGDQPSRGVPAEAPGAESG